MKMKLQQNIEIENDNIFKKTIFNKQMNELLLGERDVIDLGLDVPRIAAGAPFLSSIQEKAAEIYHKGPSHVNMFLNQRIEPKILGKGSSVEKDFSRAQKDCAGGYQYISCTRRNWAEVVLSLKYVHRLGERLPSTFPRIWE